MGDFLYVRFEKDVAPLGLLYCWAAIFEAMHRSQFQFQLPGKDTKKGVYFSSEKYMDELEVTFQELWSTLCAKDEDILVSFWNPSPGIEEHFKIQVSVYMKTEKHAQIDVTLEDGYLSTGKHAQNIFRVKALLQACMELYELYAPSTIKMFWDEEYTNLLRIRPSAQEELLGPILFRGYQLEWVPYAHILDETMYILHPMPLHMGNRFVFHALV